ncbi:hypothetical protein SAMN05877753_105286 [Bacillus oleivorans]|uniref:Uncharacterized protein n=1 Tax=Bacillus oleivorans TaxID=1448271 RepID=A0A285CWU6_9BACI|nr:hypothetical protein [Bacillus oleivorans]SNX71538.1 hypothetical protein SAMN05877753_105286 [Bacillus oleivorans]
MQFPIPNQNEQGSALIWTLLISSVLTILALTLISFNVTQSKQNGKTESLIQEINLAEMGILDFRNRIYSYLLSEPGPNTLQELNDWVLSNFPGTVDHYIEQTENQFGYQIFNIQTVQPAENQLNITFQSKGFTDTTSSGKTLTNTIYITASTGPGSSDDPIDGGSDGSDWGPEEGDAGWDIIVPTNPDSGVYDGDTLFQGKVIIDSPNDEIIITGHAKFAEDVEFSKPNGSITIGKDGLFEGVMTLDASKTTLIVGGNARFSEDFNLLVSNGRLSVGENAIFEKNVNVTGQNGIIEIGSGALVYGDITLDTNTASFIVGRDAKFGGTLTLTNKSYLNVGLQNACNANFHGPVFLFGGASISIGGSAIFQNTLSLQENGSSLTIQGDAVFQTIPSVAGQSEIVVNGDVYMNGTPPARMQVSGNIYPYDESITGFYSCTAPDGSGWEFNDEIQY